jgi:hypothetical protein
MAKHGVLSTPSEIEKAIEAGKQHQQKEVLAESVEYDPSPGHDYVTLHLNNGHRHLIPREDLQGMEKASPEAIRDVQVTGGGTALHWPQLDLDFYVPALLKNKYGNMHWMQHLGRKGGSAKTELKRKTAQANGARGGRPSKATQEHNLADCVSR